MFKIQTLLVFYSLGPYGNGVVSYFSSTIVSKGTELLIPTISNLAWDHHKKLAADAFLLQMTQNKASISNRDIHVVNIIRMP
jgi:hypothetical protein